MSDDKRIVEDAQFLLRSTQYSVLGGIDCSSEAGEVTLRGHVPTYFHKQMAQHVIAHLPQVKRVVNFLVVRSSDLQEGAGQDRD